MEGASRPKTLGKDASLHKTLGREASLPKTLGKDAYFHKTLGMGASVHKTFEIITNQILFFEKKKEEKTFLPRDLRNHSPRP